MKAQSISAVIGFSCFVLGAAIVLLAHGGTAEDLSLFGRTLAFAGAIIVGAALISYTIAANSRKH